MYTAMLLPKLVKTEHLLKSVYLERDVALEFFIPEGLMGNEPLNLLLLNDGQETVGLGLQQMLNSLYQGFKIEPLVVVAIKAGADRLQEYGVAGQPDFLDRGSKAAAYTDFIIKELFPFVHGEVALPINGKRAFAGFSLGGLSAFDLVWNNDRYFDAVGVFSGSFWWRKKDLKDGYTDDDRILHQSIAATAAKPELKFWLMTGTEDELADRNRNFIIDSIDDTVDVIKALLKKGYQRPHDITYYEMVGGKHDVHTWGRAMPAFLCWAFGRKITKLN
ncbi:putative esterase [Pedobacter heparinus DSM 2366]|uniref:Putative esterase n=3 Tax=Sphingobacteriaceae TaxID=84566 RepID=C6XWF3_PEDHD|nr:putative esterase [Pedobacter heparinus DSM 2366]